MLIQFETVDTDMQAAVESKTNVAGGSTQKSSMKNTARGVRPSSSRRKVVISDDPKRQSGMSGKGRTTGGVRTMQDTKDM